MGLHPSTASSMSLSGQQTASFDQQVTTSRCVSVLLGNVSFARDHLVSAQGWT